jgi:hypothetical protein
MALLRAQQMAEAKASSRRDLVPREHMTRDDTHGLDERGACEQDEDCWRDSYPADRMSPSWMIGAV